MYQINDTAVGGNAEQSPHMGTEREECMKYIATLMYANDTTRTAITIDASDACAAHIAARKARPDATRITVAPDTTDTAGLMMGALMVARVTARNAILRTGGNDTQRAIDADLRAANARLSDAVAPERIIDVIASTGHDAQDFYSICQLALLNGQAAGLDTDAQYREAYRALNTAVHAMQTAHATEVCTEYIRDNGGDIISLNRAIARIMRGGDRWTDADGGIMPNADALLLGDVLHDALQACKPVQQGIARLLAVGYSQRQIATRMGRGVATIARNVADMRKTVSDHIRTHAPQYSYLLPSAPIDAAVQGSNVAGGHKDAAYYRAYRAARKAAQTNSNA